MTTPHLWSTPLHPTPLSSALHSTRLTGRSVMTVAPTLTPPLGLDATTVDEDSLLKRVLDSFKGLRPGADLTSLRIPAQFNLPKSQLQLYGESVYCSAHDLLAQCAQAPTALDRFLAVVRWHVSTIRPPVFLRAPYNPVLGETHHVTVGDLNVLLEQVSHHPPVTALHATNEERGIELSWWQRPDPRFYGSNMEVSIVGPRLLVLRRKQEEYESRAPNLSFRFFPRPGAEWVGQITVSCAQSGFEATVSCRSRSLFGLLGACNRVQGKVWDTRTGQTLFDLNGNWDKIVSIKDRRTGKASVFYDGSRALSGLPTPAFENDKELLHTESVVVWAALTDAILKRDWDKAREAKKIVEEQQRQRRTESEDWSPKYFVRSPKGDWRWRQNGQPVPRAPIVVPPAPRSRKP